MCFTCVAWDRILGITWQDRVTNYAVLEKAGIPSLYTLLKQRRMRWLGHVTRMEDGRIPKDLLYGELATTTTLQRHMQVRTPSAWHKHRLLGSYCHRQRCLETHSKTGVITIWRNKASKAEEKRLHKKTVCLANRPATAFTCSKCDRNCHSRIGLHSHNRRCTMGANLWSFETDRCQWHWQEGI